MEIDEAQYTSNHSKRSRRRLIVILLLILVLIIVLLLLLDRDSARQRGLPISYRYPTTTLIWNGFRIHADSCDAIAGSSGFVGATVKGTAVVPNDGPGFTVVGQVEAWILDSSGHVIARGKPWPLPKSPGQYNLTISGFTKSSAQPAFCVLQGINVAAPYDVPQSPASPSNASVD